MISMATHMSTIKVTDYICNYLSARGIRDIFMISGGGAMHLVDSVGRNKGLHYWCPHHEQAAAIAAEGYFRASGRVAVVVVTSGPGSTNTLTGVIGQWLDSIPAMYISGQLKRKSTISAFPRLRLRQLGDQEINIVDIVKPVTKYAVMVKNPYTIRYHLEKALYLSTHGRPGPVWLDIPLDVQAALIDEKKCAPYHPEREEPRADKKKLQQQVAVLLRRMQRSERPVFFAGHGIRLAEAEKLFLQLINKLQVPVVTAICGHDLIWSDHPLFFGRPGICGDRLGNFVIQNSDFMLAVGARLGIRQISYNYKAFARAAYKVMVDIDMAELRKPTLRIDLPIHADAKEFILEMLAQLPRKPVPAKKEWLSWCRQRKQLLPSIVHDNSHNDNYVSSYLFADELFKLLPAGSQVVTGNGTAYTSTYQIMKIKKGVRVFANQGCASMGYDLPAAIGAAIGRRKGPIVLITGDGSIQMNIQELQTIVFYRLPVKIFVLNNEGYLAIRTTQDTYFNGRYFASSKKGRLGLPDLRKVARAYGFNVRRISTERNLTQKIKQALALPGPVLCEVTMDPYQTLHPKVASEATPDGRLVSKPLEDMYPFLPRGEFKTHMIIDPLHE